MIKRFRLPFVALTMVVYWSMLFSVPAIAGMADPVFSSAQTASAQVRELEIKKIQRALENEVVKEKLRAYGLNENEISAKLSGLSDDDIHTLAKASDDVLSGGFLGFVIAVLIIVLLVIVIIKIMDKDIVIKDKK